MIFWLSEITIIKWPRRLLARRLNKKFQKNFRRLLGASIMLKKFFGAFCASMIFCLRALIMGIYYGTFLKSKILLIRGLLRELCKNIEVIFARSAKNIEGFRESPREARKILRGLEVVPARSAKKFWLIWAKKLNNVSQVLYLWGGVKDILRNHVKKKSKGSTLWWYLTPLKYEKFWLPPPPPSWGGYNSFIPGI